jgi:hypothetical protein
VELHMEDRCPHIGAELADSRAHNTHEIFPSGSPGW